jgi:hypothetical protein
MASSIEKYIFAGNEQLNVMKTKWFGIVGLTLLASAIMLTTCGLKNENRTAENSFDDPEGIDTVRPVYKTPPLPDSIRFVDEAVPIDRFDVRENLERELLVNAYFHSQTIRLIKMAPRFFSIIDPILKEEGIPADFRYLAVAESGLNPKAVSPASAVGMWQLISSAAKENGLEVTSEVDERYHIEKSTRAASKYLRKAFAKYRDWALVAASYNAGLAGIDRHLARQKVASYYDLLLAEETERYVYRIMALKLILEDPAKYGFSVSEEELYPLWKTKEVEINGPVTDFADFAISHGITYKTLKYYNPWLRDTKLTNKEAKSYLVKIPLE